MKDAPCSVGDRIRLLTMPDDLCPIPAGTCGSVTGVTRLWGDKWQIIVKWDIKRSLSLITPKDTFEIIVA